MMPYPVYVTAEKAAISPASADVLCVPMEPYSRLPTSVDAVEGSCA